MIRFLWRTWWRASSGHRLRPWKSPYLRWRIETYWGLHAERITAGDFFRFAWQRRADLLRYLRWAARMETAALGPSQMRSAAASSLSPRTRQILESSR
jgi:hypothetical protein